jgi:hypothetical protein
LQSPYRSDVIDGKYSVKFYAFLQGILDDFEALLSIITTTA